MSKIPSGPSPFDAINDMRMSGANSWLARELMPLLGYDQWRNFIKTIRTAKEIYATQGGEYSGGFCCYRQDPRHRR